MHCSATLRFFYLYIHKHNSHIYRNVWSFCRNVLNFCMYTYFYLFLRNSGHFYFTLIPCFVKCPIIKPLFMFHFNPIWNCLCYYLVTFKTDKFEEKIKLWKHIYQHNFTSNWLHFVHLLFQWNFTWLNVISYQDFLYGISLPDNHLDVVFINDVLICQP